MDWPSLRYWYEDLEPVDKWKLAGLVTLVLVLLVPWRQSALAEARVQPREGQAGPLLAPAKGRVKEVTAEKDAVRAQEAVIYTYVVSADPAAFAGNAYSLGATPGSLAYVEEERRVREDYQRQIREAYAYITSDQQQLNRAYSEQGLRPRGGLAYDVQLAQNALQRAQAVPAELSRKMELELASIRRQRDDFNRTNLNPGITQNFRQQAGSDDLPVRVDQRVLVMAIPIRPGNLVSAGSGCATLLPEGAAMVVQAAIPVPLAKELRAGMPATLEVTAWLHDADEVPLVLEKVGNRGLETDEVAALAPKAGKDTSYTLVTFTPVRPDSGLFPPPANCRIRVKGAWRCLLQRLLF